MDPDPGGDSDPLDSLFSFTSLFRIPFIRKGRVFVRFYQAPFVFISVRTLGCTFGLISSFDDLLLYRSLLFFPVGSFFVRWLRV